MDEEINHIYYNFIKESENFQPDILINNIQVKDKEHVKIDFEKEFKIGKLNTQRESKLRKLILEFKDVCSIGIDNLEKTDIIKHRIRITTEIPVSKKPYTIVNLMKKKKLKEELDRMEEAGIIRKSMNPWSTPVTVVDKPDETIRKCEDYRGLNDITITDAYGMSVMNKELEKFR